MAAFKIAFLDHVALHVKDLDVSASWYEKVLGLQKYQLPKWGRSPIFLLSGKSGIALFQADIKDPEIPKDSNNIKIDHFAFNVTKENFEKAKERYHELGLQYILKDHHYFQSIYTEDPDGHTVELTTIMIDPEKFYL